MAGSDDIESVLHEGRMFPPSMEARHVRDMAAYGAMNARALADPSHTLLSRARLLPAEVEVAALLDRCVVASCSPMFRPETISPGVPRAASRPNHEDT